MTATWVDGGYVNGTAEQAYGAGLLFVQAPWGYALSLIVGGLWFAPIMRRHGFTTLLDPFEQRFGKKSAALLYMPALTGEVFWTAAILTALGTTFGLILDLDVSWSIVLSAAVVLFYTFTGGLWAVAITDVAQLFVLIIGLAVVVPFVAHAVGGFSHGLQAYHAAVASRATPVNWWTWGDTALLLVFGGIPWHVYFQRVLAARDEDTARRLSLLAGTALHGGGGAARAHRHARLRRRLERARTPGPEASLVLPYVLRHLTPPLVAALGLGAVSAAVMSSIDASVLSASSMAAWNVYRPLVEPDASSARLTLVLEARGDRRRRGGHADGAPRAQHLHALGALQRPGLLRPVPAAAPRVEGPEGEPVWLVRGHDRSRSHCASVRANRSWACPCSCRSRPTPAARPAAPSRPSPCWPGSSRCGPCRGQRPRDVLPVPLST